MLCKQFNNENKVKNNNFIVKNKFNSTEIDDIMFNIDKYQTLIENFLPNCLDCLPKLILLDNNEFFDKKQNCNIIQYVLGENQSRLEINFKKPKNNIGIVNIEVIFKCENHPIDFNINKVGSDDEEYNDLILKSILSKINDKIKKTIYL